MTRFVSELLFAAGLCPQSSKLPVGEKLVIFVKRSLLSFLRSAALLFHFLTNISPPSLLREANCSDDIDPVTEYNILAGYLGLSPKLHDLLDSPSLRQLSLSWVKHPRVHLLASNAVVQNKSPTEIPLKLISQPHEVNHLIVLPKDYSELINSVSNFTCPNSDLEDSRSPTMCLVCGTMLCSQSYCCQTELEGQMVGACTHHTHFCGAGVGIFLRIRDCKVLLLAGKSKGLTIFALQFCSNRFLMLFSFFLTQAVTCHRRSSTSSGRRIRVWFVAIRCTCVNPLIRMCTDCGLGTESRSRSLTHSKSPAVWLPQTGHSSDRLRSLRHCL